MSPDQLPSQQVELAEYKLHENSLEDLGYRRFLSRLANPLLEKLTVGSVGLDYGCGPAPLLAKILEENGHQCFLFDPFFQDNTDWPSRSYDFICCSEAIEHFHTPFNEWGIWQRHLKPGGWLAIMTKRALGLDKFKTWHYKNDKTHVSFFSEETFRWLASEYKMSFEFVSNDVVLMQNMKEI